jgi:hypothetical protein
MRERRAALNTPAALRALLVGLVLLFAALGAVGGWAATQHSSAADAVVNVDESHTLTAAEMYEAIADADATVTGIYLQSSLPPLATLQRYQGDIKTATADLAVLEAASVDPAETTALAAIGPGLNAYVGDINSAKTEYAMGYPLTGSSFLQVASEEAHVVLLPSANKVFTEENAALSAASGQATELPSLIIAVVLAVITGVVLFRAQRWLTRRTNRIFNAGLVAASVLLVVSTLWLAVGTLAARSDLNRGLGHGSGPAEKLALASIAVQQIRGDAVLNVISRSGNASFQDNFTSTSQCLGPGAGPATDTANCAAGHTLLGDAAAAQLPGSPGAAAVAAAESDATSWYAANANVYKLGLASNYSGERASVVGAGGSGTGYTMLGQNINAAIASDQEVFRSAAASGAHTLDPLAGVVIAAAILMALATAWAITRRLAEYR